MGIFFGAIYVRVKNIDIYKKNAKNSPKIVYQKKKRDQLPPSFYSYNTKFFEIKNSSFVRFPVSFNRANVANSAASFRPPFFAPGSDGVCNPSEGEAGVDSLVNR